MNIIIVYVFIISFKLLMPLFFFVCLFVCFYLSLENGILHNTVFYVIRIINIGLIPLGSQVTISEEFIDQLSLSPCGNPGAGSTLSQ